MNKVTYLFGAGASQGVLPVVSEMPNALNTLIMHLYKFRDHHPEPSNKTYHLLLDLIEEFKWLVAACEKHASIDTFAKKLFIKGAKRDLYKLKMLLSLFFAHRQAAAGNA